MKEWTGMDFASLTRAAEDRTRLEGVVAKLSVEPLCVCKIMGRPDNLDIQGKQTLFFVWLFSEKKKTRFNPFPLELFGRVCCHGMK